jgi:SnoaL-like domain
MNFTGPLEDRIAIRELCEQYCDGVMSRDMAMWGVTWAEDAEWTTRGNTIKSRASIVAEAARIIDSASAGFFFCNLGRTHIDGNRGTGRCYHVEIFWFADGPAWFLTYYDDHYVKIGGRWYFQKRSLTLMKNGKLSP